MCEVNQCQSVESFSGVTKYSELNAKLIAAHRRVVAGMGQEVFQERILNQFGLVLTDDDVTDLAVSLGWNTSWLAVARASRPAIPRSHDLAGMLTRSSPATLHTSVQFNLLL